MITLEIKLTSTQTAGALKLLEELISRIRTETQRAMAPGQWEGQEMRTAHTLIKWDGKYTVDHAAPRLHDDVFGSGDR